MSGTYDKEQMKKVIYSVMEKTKDVQMQSIRTFYDELSTLSETIDKLHSDITASKSGEVSGLHVPSATDELDAVVGATENASASIMDACDSIQTSLESVEDETAKSAITEQVMNIYEACSFQDITGQRITKVVKTLREIEGSVDGLLSLVGEKNLQRGEAVDERSEDEKLMNGPQLDGEGMSQEDIDKLLAEFD
jgi:chemotaxis protein CheZ